MKTCDYITTTGEVLRQHMIDGLDFPPDKIMSIPSGIDLDTFKHENADGRAFRREIGVSDDAPLIGTVSMIYPVKGLDYFIEAAATVASKRKDARFVIVGDIPSPDCAEYKEKLLGLIESHDLTDKVILPGFRSDVPNIMAAFDIFVLASLNEGLPQVLMQAMAMERPSIATNVGSVSELITDGETGHLIPKEDAQSIADAISSLLSDTEKTKELGLNARRRVEDGYSITAMMDKTNRVYDSLLTTSIPPSHIDA